MEVHGYTNMPKREDYGLDEYYLNIEKPTYQEEMKMPLTPEAKERLQAAKKLGVRIYDNDLSQAAKRVIRLKENDIGLQHEAAINHALESFKSVTKEELSLFLKFFN